MPHLPFNLAKIVISYLPLKKLQLWQEINPSLFDTDFNNQWFKRRYGISAFDLTDNIDNNIWDLLTQFELLCFLGMNMGDIGYVAQFYIPLDIALAYSILAKDLELLNYYLIRFISPTNSNLLDELGIPIGSNTVGDIGKKIKILTYLANQYFPPALTLLTQFNLVPKRNSDIVSFDIYDYLLYTNKIVDILDDLPAINIENLWKRIEQVGLVTKKLVANAEKLLTIINDDNSNYIKILKLLTNQDFDITSFITDDATNTFNSRFLSLAFSVLNGPICQKIVVRTSLPGRPPQRISIVVSEVLYDTNPALINAINPAISRNIITLSVCLAKEQYKYILTSGISYLIDQPNQLKLYKDYKGIVDAKDNELEDYEEDHVGADVMIYDAETAERLDEVVDVKPYLYPITDFSKNLMTQYGLL